MNKQEKNKEEFIRSIQRTNRDPIMLFESINSLLTDQCRLLQNYYPVHQKVSYP